MGRFHGLCFNRGYFKFKNGIVLMRINRILFLLLAISLMWTTKLFAEDFGESLFESITSREDISWNLAKKSGTLLNQGILKSNLQNYFRITFPRKALSLKNLWRVYPQPSQLPWVQENPP